MWNPAYEHDNNELVHAYALNTGNTIRYNARTIRKETTGIHARVSISINFITLAWTSFNVERDEDRVRLSNSAYSAWGKDAELDLAEWPKTSMKKALDLFCEGLWEEQVRANKGELLCGDPDQAGITLLLDKYLVDGGGTIMFAPPGRGKSYTAMLMACSLDAGIETLWRLPVGAKRCLYINLERSRESMQRRLTAVNRVLDLDPRRGLPFINARGRTLADVLESARETAREHQAEVVFLDSISRTGYGDLTADRVVNQVMDDLNSTFPTWFALAHTPRQDQTHVFGSQMFDAAADVILSLTAQTSADRLTTGVGLQVTKANDSPLTEVRTHAMCWNDAGLTGVRPGRRGEFPEIEAGQNMSLEDTIVELLEQRGAMSGTQIADELGKQRTSIARVLGASGRFVIVRREGHRVFYGVHATVTDPSSPRYD